MNKKGNQVPLQEGKSNSYYIHERLEQNQRRSEDRVLCIFINTSYFILHYIMDFWHQMEAGANISLFQSTTPINIEEWLS